MSLRRWILVSAMLAVSAPAQRPAHSLSSSIQKEIALGAQLTEELWQNNTPLDVPDALAYVERIGRTLAPELPGGFEYTFAVLGGADKRTREPLVLPGGYVFVPAGLFLAAENEAEFAGMLAHSMAHAALRHGTRQARRGAIADYASIPVEFMGGPRALHGGDDDAMIPLGLLKFVRSYELEADRAAALAIARVGYDPAALVRHIDRTQVDNAPPQRSALPPRQERLAELERTMMELPARKYAAESGEFERVRAAVRAAVYPRGTPQPPTLRRK